MKRRYFHTREAKNGILNSDKYILNQHSDVSIIRHIKVKGNKSPYDSD
jgi:hypothetical protein